MTENKKKFPPIFWVAFGALVVLNVSVFFDYQKPLERYQKFAKVKHSVNIKTGSIIYDIKRGDETLPQCLVSTGAVLEWVSFAGKHSFYQYQPTLAATAGQSNQDVMCQQGDTVAIDTTSEDNANTLLVLLSIDFDRPLVNN